MEQLLKMDHSLFEALFGAWSRRVAIERLEAQRDSMIAAMLSNPNYDSKEGAAERRKRMEQWDDKLEEAVELIYGDGPVTDTQLEENEFYAPAVRARNRLARMTVPEDVRSSVKAEIDAPRGDDDLDQS